MYPDYTSPVNEYWRHRRRLEKHTRQQLEEEVEATLKGVFRRDYYGYELYVENAEIYETYITVLGRAVQPEDAISEPCDRLLVPADD